MKKITIVDYSSNNSLIMSILFLILGIVLFTNPGGVVEFISYIFGAFLIIVGISNFFSYRRKLSKLNIDDKSLLTLAIVFIILGILSIIFASLIESLIRLIIGGWVLYSGIMRLIYALNLNTKNKSLFIATLVIAFLMIMCGFYVIFNKNLVFSAIGLFIAIYAIMDIVGYIFNSRK